MQLVQTTLKPTSVYMCEGRGERGGGVGEGGCATSPDHPGTYACTCVCEGKRERGEGNVQLVQTTLEPTSVPVCVRGGG